MRIRQMLAEIGLSNPYRDFDARSMTLDLQGWGSEHPWFERFIRRIAPAEIIEVGTWKGASAVTMARHALQANPDGTTTLQGRSWYRNSMWPAVYWRLWSDRILHDVHRSVFEHLKRLSETA